MRPIDNDHLYTYVINNTAFTFKNSAKSISRDVIFFIVVVGGIWKLIHKNPPNILNKVVLKSSNFKPGIIIFFCKSIESSKK